MAQRAARKAPRADAARAVNTAARSKAAAAAPAASPAASPAADARFDAAYYRRFYRNPRTRATDPGATRRLAGFIAAYAAHLGIRVRRAVDVGCGTGDLLRALAQHWPSARMDGVEVSEWACARYGWQRASAVEFVRPAQYDLVVCTDVLQYLDDHAASRALANLCASSRALLYVGARTRRDVDDRADPSRSDLSGHYRSANWYRRRLARDYVALGGALFVRKELELPVWELERPR